MNNVLKNAQHNTIVERWKMDKMHSFADNVLLNVKHVILNLLNVLHVHFLDKV